MNWQRIWNDPVWSKVIAGVILAAGSVALALAPKELVGLGLLMLLTVIACALLLWTLFRRRLSWNFDNFLGMVSGRGDIRVVSFQATGLNRSRKGFCSVTGHLVSDIDNSVSDPLRFVIGGTPVLPSATTGIPPRASFQVMVPLCDMTKGYDAYLKEHDFLNRWSAFRFMIEMDDYRYEKRFSRRRVAEQVNKFKKVANPLPQSQVRIKQ
jgi:hypothetical protein